MVKYKGILAVDPGVRNPGFAIFEKDKLVYVDVPRSAASLNQLVAIEENVEKMARAWEREIGKSFNPEVLVVEKMQVYPSKVAYANNLIPLAIMAGLIWGRFAPKNVVLPEPRLWKGGVEKMKHNEQTLNGLSQSEMEIMKETMIRVPESLRNNGYDAIGLGRWYIMRDVK